MNIARVTTVTIAALCLVPLLAPNVFAADVPLIRLPERTNPTHVTFVYDSADGSVSVNANNDGDPAPGTISRLNLVSASGQFLPGNAAYHYAQFPNRLPRR